VGCRDQGDQTGGNPTKGKTWQSWRENTTCPAEEGLRDKVIFGRHHKQKHGKKKEEDGSKKEEEWVSLLAVGREKAYFPDGKKGNVFYWKRFKP